ncbi:MAG: hypothetical protein QXF40_04690 [Metallosphaera sp.]
MIGALGLFLTVTTIAVAHGLEPDHISATRMIRGMRRLAYLGLSHSIGFVIVAIPISLLLIYFTYLKPAIELVSYGIGIGLGAILLVSAILKLDIELEPKGTGLIQGMFSITPSKVITIIIAMDTGSMLLGTGLILWFATISALSIIGVGMLNLRAPGNLDRTLDVIVASITIGYFGYYFFLDLK